MLPPGRRRCLLLHLVFVKRPRQDTLPTGGFPLLVFFLGLLYLVSSSEGSLVYSRRCLKYNWDVKRINVLFFFLACVVCSSQLQLHNRIIWGRLKIKQILRAPLQTNQISVSRLGPGHWHFFLSFPSDFFFFNIELGLRTHWVRIWLMTSVPEDSYLAIFRLHDLSDKFLLLIDVKTIWLFR